MVRWSSVWVWGALLFVACNRQESTVTKPVAVVAPALPNWTSGKRFLYTTNLNSKLVLGGQGLMGFDMVCTLRLEARQVGPDVEFLAEISEPEFKGNTPDSQAQFDSLSKELQEPFGFSTTRGALSSLQLPPTWSRFAVSISRTIAAALQLAAADAGQQGPSWKAKEVDATGRYDVEYTVAPGTPGHLSRHKLSYDSLSLGKGVAIGQFGAKATPEVVESKGELTLGADGTGPQLSLVDYHEKLKIQLTPTSLVDSETRLRLAYERVDTTGASRDWEVLLSNTKKLAPDQVPTGQTPSNTYDAQRIGDYTFAKALKELEANARDPQRNQLVESVRGVPFEPEQLKERKARLAAQEQAFVALAALIRTDKKNIPLAVAGVRARSPALQALLDALASAGTPEAQAALVSIIDDGKLKLPLRSAAASSLIRTEHASAESVKFLETHVGVDDPLHVFSLYGLGTISRRLRDAGEVPRADAIVQNLLTDLSRASAGSEQVDVLRAIANSGGAAAFDAVVPLLSAPSGNVRVAAIDALRLMQRPEVDGIIAERLGQPDALIQDAALDAISVRTPSPALTSALEKATTSAVKPGLRVKAVRIMVQWLPQRAELRKSLEQLAQSDPLEEIRKLAKDALGS